MHCLCWKWTMSSLTFERIEWKSELPNFLLLICRDRNRMSAFHFHILQCITQKQGFAYIQVLRDISCYIVQKYCLNSKNRKVQRQSMIWDERINVCEEPAALKWKPKQPVGHPAGMEMSAQECFRCLQLLQQVEHGGSIVSSGWVILPREFLNLQRE